MQNKLYTTLANLYSEIKEARKNKSSLGEAIDDSIANQEEVLNARGDFFDLKTRLDNLSGLVSTVDVKYEALKSDIYNIDIKPTPQEIPIVNIEGKDMLVSLQNKIAYHEDCMTLLPGEQRILVNENNNNMYESYMKTNSTISSLKTYSFNNESDVLFNSSINSLTSNVIAPKQTGDLYKLPLHMSKLFSMDQLDAAILPSVCSITSDYATPTTNADGSLNYSNHLINPLRGDGEWVVDRSFVTVTISMDRAIPIIKLVNKHSSNTSICRCSIDISTDGTSWSSIYSGGVNDLSIVLPTERIAKFIRYTYNSFDGSSVSNKITISNISLYLTEYNNNSGVIETVRPIPIYDEKTEIRLITTGSTDEDSHIITRFAISNVDDNSERWATYIPQSYTILPVDFFDDAGLKYVNSVLQNNIKLNIADDVIFATKSYGNYTLTTVGGTVGNISISLEARTNDSNAWKIDETAYFKVYVVINGVEHVIPLSLDNVNKEIVSVIGGVEIGIVLSILNNNVMKAYVYPSSSKLDTNVTVDEIRVEVFGVYFAHGTSYVYSNSSMSTYSYINYMDGYPVNTYEVYNYYRIYYNWFFNFNNFGTSYSPTRTVSGITCAIIPSNMKTSQASVDTIRKTIGSNTFSVAEIRNKCSLPAHVYIGYGGTTILNNAIASDTTGVTRSVKSPVFTYKKEYKTKVFISDSSISKIVVDQEITSDDDIKYFVSFDDMSYYVFDKEIMEWKARIDNKGMSGLDLSYPNETMYNKIKCSEWLYIKVILNSPSAKLNKITVQFVDDSFALIDKAEIHDKGMFKRHIENIKPQSLLKYLSSNYSIMRIAQTAYSMLPIYKYELSGYNIQNYNDLQWEHLDSTKVKEYLLPNNSLVYKNVSKSNQDVKVIRRIIENQVAVVDTEMTDSKVKDILDEAIKPIAEKEFALTQNLQLLGDNIEILQQNISLLHDGMLDGNVPSELPDVMLPDVTEINVPVLKESESYRIPNVTKLRGIQVWEELSNFTQQSETLLFDSAHANKYISSGVVFSDAGATIDTDYNRDSPHLLSESGTKISSTQMKYPDFDFTLSLPPEINDITSVLANDGSEAWTSAGRVWAITEFGANELRFRSTKYSSQYGCNVKWTTPGEDVRWVDMILDFRHYVWINYIADADFGVTELLDNAFYMYTNQKTTFSYSKDGKEYIDVKQFTGGFIDQTITFEKELRYIRVRLELPYSANFGRGRVSFNEMDIYGSLVNYNTKIECYLYNRVAIDTSQWGNFNKIKVDRFIDHNPAEMKFLISDDPNRNSWKYWNGSKWLTTTTVSLASAMSIETLLALQDTELNQLEKGSLYIAAVMKTSDVYKTPVLREMEFIHDVSKSDTDKYYSMIDLHTIDFKYSYDSGEIIITNNTTGPKKLKIVLL